MPGSMRDIMSDYGQMHEFDARLPWSIYASDRVAYSITFAGTAAYSEAGALVADSSVIHRPASRDSRHCVQRTHSLDGQTSVHDVRPHAGCATAYTFAPAEIAKWRLP